MHIILLILIIFALVVFPHFRNIVMHPLLTIYYAPRDLYKYIKYKRWRECKAFGSLDMFCSDSSKVFGNGKTLSGVNYVVNLYKLYNNKKVYDFDEKQWITQRIIVLSNVEFTNIDNYERLTDAQQIVNRHEDLKNGEVLIVYVDEAGILFNSRSFKDNIGQDLLNAMLTCRKKKFGMLFTAQRFNQVDALIRQLTSRVFMAEKLWRSVVLRCFSGYDMEYCTNPQYLTSSIFMYFATDKLFASYDTNQGVEDIKNKKKKGEMLTDAEILESQGTVSDSVYNVRSGNRKFKKTMKGGK